MQEIYNRTRGDIPDEELELAQVDGPNDLGVDFVHRDDNQVLLLQGKFRGQGKSEAPETISHFKGVLTRLSNPKIRANERLADRLAEIDISRDSFHLVFLTFGELDNQALKIAEQPAEYPSKYPDMDQRCQWDFLDERRIDEEYRNALSLGRGIPDTKITLFPVGKKGQRGQSLIEINAGEYRSYLMALDANQLIRAYEQLGRDSLFSLNIRNFIGRTKQNSEIRATALQNPERFFLFNNGVSCLCKSFNQTQNGIEVTGFQVINGAQTVKTLVTAARQRPGQPNPWPQSAPVVLVRITEIPEGYGQAGKLREEITRSNNTQNVVKDSDFRSNDSVQEHLKTQFAQINRGAKRVVYIPKRTDERPVNAELVRVKEFAKIVYAFMQDQVSFSDSTSFLFDNSEAGGYNKVFGDGKDTWPKMPEDEFRLRAAIYWLGLAIGDQMKLDKEATGDADERAALERKWPYIYGARVVLQFYFSGDDWKAQLSKTYRGDWQLGKDQRGKWMQRIYNYSKLGVIQTYRNAKRYDPHFTHRAWTRSPETPAKIAETLRDLLKSLEPLTPLP